jgi:hypothetical protein
MGALSPLTSLEVLTIRRMSPGHLLSSLDGIGDLAASLQRLHCNAYGISSLAPISVLSSLQTLDLWDLDHVSDLGPISVLSSLLALDLRYLYHVSDLGPIGHLPSLRQLHISQGCYRISSLAPLSRLGSVQELKLASLPKVRSLQPIGSLSALQQLNLLGLGMVSSLQPLSHLRSLHRLCLVDMGAVSSLEPLSALTGLRDFTLVAAPYWEQVTTFSGSYLAPLDSLTGLQKLEIRDYSCCLQYMRTATPARPAIIFPGECIPRTHSPCSSAHLQATNLPVSCLLYKCSAFRVDKWNAFLLSAGREVLGRLEHAARMMLGWVVARVSLDGIGECSGNVGQCLWLCCRMAALL